MIKMYLDSADLDEISKWEPEVDGFTTNPTLMRKAHVQDYAAFAHEMLSRVHGKPVSFEVVTESRLMDEARIIASWGENVYVKVPILNTKGKSNIPYVMLLMDEGIKVNLTGIVDYTLMNSLTGIVPKVPVIVSIFAGRIKDAGSKPPVAWTRKNYVYLWASTREVDDVREASDLYYDIITVTPEILSKWKTLKGRDLAEYTKATVCQFYEDARLAGYELLPTPGLDTPPATMVDSPPREEGST